MAKTMKAAVTASRSDVKRRSIIDAATRLFLDQGYSGTSMDEIAAVAEVSKQTVYKQFHDKDQLFSDIVLGITERADVIAAGLRARFDDITDLEADLTTVAIAYATGVVGLDVIRLRRLVIAEAGRFPELAEAYFNQGPQRGLTAVADGLNSLVQRGLLAIDDCGLAAVHFAYLVLGPLIDRALFLPHEAVTAEQIQRCATSGLHAFLRVNPPVGSS